MSTTVDLKWCKTKPESEPTTARTAESTDETPPKLVALESKSEPVLKMPGAQYINLTMSTNRAVTRDLDRFVNAKTIFVCCVKPDQQDAYTPEVLQPPDGFTGSIDECAELLASSVNQLMVNAGVTPLVNMSIVAQRVAGFLNVSTVVVMY